MLKRLKAIAQEENFASRESAKILLLITGAVFPVIAVAFSKFIDIFKHDLAALLLCCIIFVLLFGFHVYSLYILTKFRSANEALMEMADHLVSRKADEDRLARLKFFEGNYLDWTIGQRLFLDHHDTGLKSFQYFVEQSCRAIVDNIRITLPISATADWSLTVYLHDPRPGADDLFPVWFQRSATHPASGGAPRQWQRGVGQAGRVWAELRDSFEPDAGDLHTRNPANAHAYDAAAYKSMASIPIGIDKEKKSCLGVLCVTASEKGVISFEETLIFKVWASVIGNILLMSNFDLNHLIDSAKEELL